jgi:hypothetical protein
VSITLSNRACAFGSLPLHTLRAGFQALFSASYSPEFHRQEKIRSALPAWQRRASKSEHRGSCRERLLLRALSPADYLLRDFDLPDRFGFPRLQFRPLLPLQD